MREEEEEDDNLDTKWIDEAEQELDTNPENKVRTPQNSIAITFVYMNATNSIEKVMTENYATIMKDETHAALPYSQILHLIQTKKTTNTAKYKLIEILSYVVELESTQVAQYANSNGISNEYMKVCPIYDEIKIAASLQIFHKVNAVYFIFKEKQKLSPKSILKRTHEDEVILENKTKKNYIPLEKKNSHTKRVKFF